MRTTRIILFTLLAVLTISSCSKPTTVAQKALKIAGKGTFVPSSYDISIGREPLSVIGLFVDYDEIFSSALIRSNEAEAIIKTGKYKECKGLCDREDL